MNTYIIIGLVILFLVGSINLVIPTKQTRMLSDLRLLARKKGIQISSLTPKQKFLTKNLKFVCYTIKNISNLKNAHYVLKESSLSLYDPIKLKFEENFEDIENKISKQNVGKGGKSYGKSGKGWEKPREKLLGKAPSI